MPVYPASVSLTSRINRTPYRNTGVGLAFKSQLLNIGVANPLLFTDSLVGTPTGIRVQQTGGFGAVFTLSNSPGFVLSGTQVLLDDIDAANIVDDYATITIVSEGYEDLVVQLHILPNGNMGVYLAYLGLKQMNRVPL